MPTNDLHDDLDQLAVDIETEITETQAFLNGLPDFSPRSQRAQKLERATSGNR